MKTGNETKPTPYNIKFLDDDIQNGLLKNKRVGMIRRTIKITVLENKRYTMFEDRCYFPECDKLVLLNVNGWLA